MNTGKPTVADYLKWAEACRAVAVAITDPHYSPMFVEMAKVWSEMAEQHERLGVVWPELLNSMTTPMPPDLRRRLH